jgi:hypothetical protein
MPDHTLRAYRRVHTFDHAVDVEQGKIKREISTYVKQSKKADHLTGNLLRDPDDAAETEA